MAVGLGDRNMRNLGIVALGAPLVGCAVSREEVVSRFGQSICGAERRRPGGEVRPTSHIWQLGNQTNINTNRGSGIASTQCCKVSIIASKTGVVSHTAAFAQTGSGWSGKVSSKLPAGRGGTEGQIEMTLALAGAW
jgi:hypothetical protein